MNSRPIVLSLALILVAAGAGVSTGARDARATDAAVRATPAKEQTPTTKAANDVSVGVDVPDDVNQNDPALIEQDGLYRQDSGSSAVDAGSGEYEFLTDDLDGQERIEAPDTGADERSTADVTRRPLTADDVGPDA